MLERLLKEYYISQNQPRITLNLVTASNIASLPLVYDVTVCYVQCYDIYIASCLRS